MPRISELPAIDPVTDTSSFVGAGPGSGRFTGAALKAYVGVVSGGAGGTATPLATSAPASLSSTAAVGISTSAARADHVHARPTLAELGASPIVHTHVQTDIAGLTAALSAKQNVSDRGAANGYAPLDASSKIPSANMPTIPTGATALDGLSDVTVTSPATGQALRYNGTQFVNAAMTIGDVTNLQTTLTGKQDASAKGQANGYAGLDGTSRVPIAQLPASVVTTDYRATVEDFSADFTAAQADNNKIKRGTSATDRTVTLAALQVGTTIRFLQGSTGKVIFAAGSGVALQSAGNLTRTSGQYADATATVVAANAWHLSGALGA